jgi:RNA polymerase sigma-70 factor, ECF subfamily
VTGQREITPAVAPDGHQSPEEAELLRAAQKGDRVAFEKLVRTYDRSVLRLALNLLRSPEDAQDVYQETFLRVYKNLHMFRADSNFHTWVYRIASNICVDYLRKRKVRREESMVVETADGERDRVTDLKERRAQSDPQRALINRRLGAKIEAVLAELTPRERVVFELRHYQGLRLRNIGEALGTSEEAAKTCLVRATQKMRAALEAFV